MSIGLIIFGLCAAVAGLSAYTGRWRGWAQRSGYSNNLGFSLAYIGIGFALMGIFIAFPQGTVPINLLIAVWMTLNGCGVIGYFWLPAFMLPKWFLESRDVFREAERAAKDLRKSARELKKARNDS